MTRQNGAQGRSQRAASREDSSDRLKALETRVAEIEREQERDLAQISGWVLDLQETVSLLTRLLPQEALR